MVEVGCGDNRTHTESPICDCVALSWISLTPMPRSAQKRPVADLLEHALVEPALNQHAEFETDRNEGHQLESARL